MSEVCDELKARRAGCAGKYEEARRSWLPGAALDELGPGRMSAWAARGAARRRGGGGGGGELQHNNI